MCYTNSVIVKRKVLKMSQLFELNNVKVTFSNLMNKDETKGKCFKIAIPEDSEYTPMLEEAIAKFAPQAKDYMNKVVNDAIEKRNASKPEGQELEKPVVVRKPDSPLVESSRIAGVYEIPFNLYHYRKKDGEDVGKLELNRKVYKDEDDLPVIYMRDKNTGEKILETPNGKKWQPLNENIVNCKVALVAGYNSKDRKAMLYFKLVECEIVKSDFGKGNKSSNTGFGNTYCVFGADTVAETQSDSTTAVATKAKPKAKSSVVVTAEELDSIDI